MAAAPAEASEDGGGKQNANGQVTGGGTETLAVPAMPGRLADVYDVQKAVGKGGYAIVYKAVRREDRRVVAVKKVEIFEMSQKKRERCLQEVKLLSKLSHPNIIQMLDAFIDDNQLIIIFEWAPAGDLKRLIKKTAEAKKTLDEPSIWMFFAQITDALLYMHQQRIMHRDIKPANVLVGANGALKIGDLGLGRQLSEQTMEAFSKVGTPYYVSPEVVRGAGYDWKSDVWSMGCLLYELACLRSPFEMEGANLYDVFQKISKGDYQPLPADTFSKSLRGLVTRMLSVEPAGRPGLDEVWSITRAIVSAQTAKSGGRVDVHTASEALHSALCLLEAEVAHRLGKQNGKHAAAAADDFATPPAAALRSLHPLFFAEPLVPPGSVHADAEQKRQLGAAMAVFAWLMRLLGRRDLGELVEAQLSEVPLPAWRGGHAPQPPRAAKRSTSGGSGASRGRHFAGGATTTAAAAATGASPSPPKAARHQPGPMVPCALGVLQGAEAIKRAAQAAGLSTEFAPVNAVALGYGRAVVAMLQDLTDAACAHLQLAPRRPRYHEQPGVDGRTGDGGDDILEVEDDAGLGEEDGVVMGAAAPLPRALVVEEEDEEAGYVDMRGLPALAPADCAPGGSGRPVGDGVPGGRGSGPGRPAAASAADPTLWYAEAERVGPQLSRIVLPVDAMGGGGGEWRQRLEDVGAQAGVLSSLAPGAVSALGRATASLDDELERIGAAERRLNVGAGPQLMAYRSSREQLLRLQSAVRGREERMADANTSLQHLNSQLLQIGERLAERADTLDGGAKIQCMHAAMVRLRGEMRQMDQRLGVVQQQLLAKQRARMARVAAAEFGPDSDDDEGP